MTSSSAPLSTREIAHYTGTTAAFSVRRVNVALGRLCLCPAATVQAWRSPLLRAAVASVRSIPGAQFRSQLRLFAAMPATRKRTRAQLKEAKLEEAPPQTCVASPTKSARIGRSKTVPTRRAATKAAPAVDAPATPKPALKRAASERKSSVKKSPSLKRSSSVASLPEGWTCIAPDTALGVEDMLESVSNDAAPAGTACKIVNWNVNGLKVGHTPYLMCVYVCSTFMSGRGVVGWLHRPPQAFMKNTKDLLVPYLEREAPDVLCLNEIKLTEDNCDSYNDKFPGYKCHFNCCTVKKGYAGTAILVREASQLGELGVTYGMGVKELDNEGRVTTLELPWGYVVVAYVPNSGMKLDRLDYRTKTWDPAFRAYLASLQVRLATSLCSLGSA